MPAAPVLDVKGGESSLTFAREVERAFEVVKQGYGYLFQIADKTGHWDEARSTSLVAMCLALREDGDSKWLRAARTWIENQQRKDGHAAGSWGEEVWDTALCLIALKEMDVSSKSPAVKSALAWIMGLYATSGRSNWHDELWETSWALLAIFRCGRTSEDVDVSEAIVWLMEFQEADGRIVAPHYTAYFILVEHFSYSLELPRELRTEMAACRQKAAAYLIGLLRESDSARLWTGEAWSNGQILWALARSGLFPIAEKPLVEKVIGWFEDAQDEKGCWSDSEDNASAILGILALLEEMVVAQAKGQRVRDEVVVEVQRRLKRAVPVPRLHIKRKLIERETDTEYITINVRSKTARLAVTVLGFLFVGFLGWLTSIISFIEYLYEYVLR